MINLYNIKKMLKKDRVIENYSSKGRLIDNTIYKKLKKKKVCQYCNKKRDGKLLQIHHKDGNRENNNENNLMVVHKHCHKILDNELK